MGKLPWPDKSALLVAWVIIGLWVLIWILALTGSPSADYLWAAKTLPDMLVWLIKAQIIVTFPLWLFVRGIDLILGGPAKRSAKQKSN